MNTKKIKRKIKISDPCLSNKKLTQKNRKYNMKCEINKGYHINNEEIYKENPDLQNSGKIFNSSDPEFQISGKHLKDPLYKKYNTFSEPTCASTYIYIISKVIDNDIYYKIGEGGKGTSKGVGRLSEAQTYLMPGLNEQSGFKVHYVFFFRKSLYLNSLFIGQHIEKTIHSILQRLFTPINITFSNDLPSEWYLISKRDESFFFGFVFDIIGSFDHEKTIPLEIWKYEESGKKNISLPKNISQRMENFDVYKNIQDSLENMGLRKKQRPISTIIDKNKYNHLQELKNYFQLYKQPYIFYYKNVEFQLTNIQSLKNYLQSYSKYYAVITCEMVILRDFFEPYSIYLETPQKFYMKIKDFLLFYKENFVEDTWSIQNILDFYQGSQYNANIQTIEEPTIQVPNYFYSKPVQLFWANKMIYEEQYMYHEDSSVDEPGVVKNWKILSYDTQDGVRIQRQEIRNGELVTGSNEFVNITRIMMLLNIYLPDKKDMRQKKRTQTEDNVFIDGIKVKKNDIVQIKDNYFIYFDAYGDPDGESHSQWSTYKVIRVYKKNNYSDSMNPWIDVKQIVNNKPVKETWELIANDTIEGKIKMKKPDTLREPLFKKNTIVRIPKKSGLFNDPKWNDDEHFITIHSIDKPYYGIKYFAPFDKNKTWNKSPYESTYIESVNIEELDKIASSNNSETSLDSYKRELPFLFMKNVSIQEHIPKKAEDHDSLLTTRSHKYVLDFDDLNYQIANTQEASDVYSFYPRKVSSYWRTLKKRNSKNKGKTMKNKQQTTSNMYRDF